MLKYLKFQKTFNAKAIQKELASFNQAGWMQHYNRQMYEGGWSVLPLRSLGGSSANIISVHDSAAGHIQYQDTEIIEHFPYTSSVLNFFECEKTAARFMKLEAGAIIKEHSDHELSFEEGEVRIHIPVITDPLVEFFLAGERIIMNEGECWYMNLSQKHSARNQSPVDRIHLVIDLKVNDWLKNLFEQPALQTKYSETITAPKYLREEQLKIIAQLRTLNTDTATAIAEQMEKDLA